MSSLGVKKASRFRTVAEVILALVILFGYQSLAFSQELMRRSWGMHSGKGIEALKAWSVAKKAVGGDCATSTAVVAIIDTGIDMNHPALKDSLWINSKEASGKNKKDDDSNGYEDDIYGYDFARNSGLLVDHHGHGTHIAGIISGNTKSGEVFRGVCPGVRIMALRYYDERASGDENLKNTIKAINYAVDNGATIINYSGGGAMFSKPEFQALKRAEEKGILVVAAAGNEHTNADKDFYYPAAYDLQNIISVTAIDTRGKILPSSNWGLSKVHVAAPGNAILSSLPNKGYGFMTGTSQATAFVSGIAALVMTENPKLKMAQVRQILEESAYRSPQLIGKTKTGAHVNAWAAVMLSQGKRSFASLRKLSDELPEENVVDAREQQRRKRMMAYPSK